MGGIRFMQLGSAFTHGFERIEYGRQHLVLYIDQAKGIFGNGRRLGSNEGHPITDVANTIIKEVSIIGRRLRIGLTSSAIGHARQVFMCKYGIHAREGKRLAFIDAADVGMSMWRVENTGV